MKSVIVTVFAFLFIVGGITTFFFLGKAVNYDANLVTGKVTEEQFLANQEENNLTPWMMMLFSVLAGVAVSFVFVSQRAKSQEHQELPSAQFQQIIQEVKKEKVKEEENEKQEKSESNLVENKGAFISLEKIATLTKPTQQQTAFLSDEDMKQRKAFEEEMEHSDLFKEVDEEKK